ncbi:hypothetical protein K443DRAFT_7711 [Laccaria amethystina LaAM-08-1]|uniref:Uncharacterized protein n=1 Tax=Laccaria amethystina LaAM-08-1 TaxID=1095629 RepID=A0A0C9XRL2_9AGAR|nr:hypothetical protein K443DRAFT_7711 [Laccaria amethystina LaAM-08-1]
MPTYHPNLCFPLPLTLIPVPQPIFIKMAPVYGSFLLLSPAKVGVMLRKEEDVLYLCELSIILHH